MCRWTQTQQYTTQRNSAKPIFSVLSSRYGSIGTWEALTLQRQEGAKSFLGRHEVEKQGSFITHSHSHKTCKSFSRHLHHPISFSAVLTHPPFTYQNTDLSIFRLIIQTTGNNKDRGSLDARGSCGHVIRNYLCRSAATQKPQPVPAPGSTGPTALLWPWLITLVSNPGKLSWRNPQLSLWVLTHFYHRCLFARKYRCKYIQILS